MNGVEFKKNKDRNRNDFPAILIQNDDREIQQTRAIFIYSLK